MKKKDLIALILNIVLVALGTIGLVIATNDGINIIEYYTEDSNILGIISSLLFVVCLLIKRDKELLPKWVLDLRFVSSCCLALTFIIVISVLAFTTYDNYFEGLIHLLTNRSMLYHHLLCPVISFISFSFFEGDRRLNKKKTIYLALIPTFIYGLVTVILNILKVIEGPYPFLMVYNQAWYMSIIWIVVIFVVNYITSRYILLINQINAPRIKRNKEV